MCLFHAKFKNFLICLCPCRQPTQDAPEEVRARDFRRELEERERVAVKGRDRGARGEEACTCDFFLWLFFRQYVFIDHDHFLFPSEHTTSSSSSSSSSKRPRLDQIPAANLDADDPLTDVHTLSYTYLGVQIDFGCSLNDVCVLG